MPIQFQANLTTLLVLGGLWAAAVVTFWWMNRQSLTDMSNRRKRLALLVRVALVSLLFFALAGARWVKRNDTLSVLFLLDASRSLSEEQRAKAEQFISEAIKSKRESDSVGLLTFGNDPDIKSLPGPRLSVVGLKHQGSVNATNIAQALEAALPLIPRNSAAKVVVLSDGNENVGSALASVPNLSARGVKVDTVMLESGLRREALVEKMILPGRVKIGEPFSVKVVTNALNEQTGKLTLFRDGKAVGAPRLVDIPKGRSVQSFDVNIDRAGFYRYEATLETDSKLDTLTENNRGLGFVSVRGKPQILYVARTPDLLSYIQKSMKDQNIDIRYAPPDAMPTTAAAFQQFDSVILSDVSADTFSQAQLNALQVSSRDFGVGFGMIGGQESFGLGGYRKTVVEEMLPVSMEIRKMQRFPPVAVGLVIDRSGSMMEGGGRGGKSKLNLALESAIRAVQALKPTDKVAVVAFDAMSHDVVPLTNLSRPTEVIAAIEAIGVGGGTSIYAGVSRAWEMMKSDDSPIKHLIVCTDGMSNDPDYSQILAEMKKQKVTITSVVIGAGGGDVDGRLPAYLAKETGGRYYPVTSAADIPRIYLQEIERISSRPIVEEPFVPRLSAGYEDRLQGLDIGGAPPLLGYNVTQLKPTADLVLRSHQNDPVLATWRYGLARVMAFTSDDKNKWAANWIGWSGYPPFWAQTIRWTMRSFTPSDFQTQVVMEGTRGHIVVDALDKEGKFQNRLKFVAKVAGPAGAADKPSESLELRQTAPGHYEAFFDAAQIGTYLVNITRELADKTVESTVSGLVVPYSPEYKDLGANEFLMTQMAQAGGGARLTTASLVFGGNRPTVYSPTDLVPWLLLLAMLLFPVDVAVRRLLILPEDVRRAMAWLKGRIGIKRLTFAPEGATPELARLKVAKRQALGGGRSDLEPRDRDIRPIVQEKSLEEPEPSSTPDVVWSVPRPEKGVVASDAGESAPDRSSPDPEESGMGRLMAAKRRANEPKKRDE